MKQWMIFAIAAIVAVSAFGQGADHGWWLAEGDVGLTIGKAEIKLPELSIDAANPTDIGYLENLVITGCSLHLWDDNVTNGVADVGGFNVFFKLFDETGATQISSTDADFWAGSATLDAGTVHDYAINYTGSFNLLEQTGWDNIELTEGTTYRFQIYGKSYGDPSQTPQKPDAWYSAEGANYHAKFTYGAAPVPEPATMSLLGLGALVLALRRRLR